MASRQDQVQAILARVLVGLEDEFLIEYLAGIVTDSSPDDDLNDVLGPFLLSMNLVATEAEAATYCENIKDQLCQGLGTSTWQEDEHSSATPELKKLENARTIDEGTPQDQEESAFLDRMWGFDKIRKQVNEQVDSFCIIQSQRQIRKQVRSEKQMEERERQEAEDDAEWEDTRVLPDLDSKTGGDTDIHVSNVNISFKGLSLLLDSEIKFIRGRRYGLIGLNGTGKTTLLRYIAKYEIEGFPKHIRIQHVAQESAEKLSISDGKRVIDVVLEADYERDALKIQERELSGKDDDESQSKLHAIYDRLIEIEADTAESRARTILNGLQFNAEMIDGPASALSGGWRMRTALAGALFMSPDLLLLDEPTNHLDLEAVVWLEQYLETYEKTLIVVSHDRNFLDTVITDVIHLHQQKLVYYRGDYSIFEQTRKNVLKQHRKVYEAQQQKIAHMQEFIDRFRCNAKKSGLVQSRVKALEKMELIEEPEDEQAFRMQFPPPEPLGRPIISLTDVAFTYPSRKGVVADGDDGEETKAISESPRPPIFSDVNFGIDMSSRIGVLGKNGSGKSTLINLILGKLRPGYGHAFLHTRLRIASFTQHHVDQLNLAKTAVDNMKELYPGIESQEFRNHLGRFNVSGNMAIKPCRKLSGGQKSRVAFAILTWKLPHIIIMDEPTNHLDIETIDALIDALKSYQGGVLIVSHDQHFVGSICKELWVVDGGKVSQFRGSIDDYKKQVLTKK